MVNESEFNDNNSQWDAWTANKDEYKKWMNGLVETQKKETRTHGFHHKGQYAEEIAAMGDV